MKKILLLFMIGIITVCGYFYHKPKNKNFQKTEISFDRNFFEEQYKYQTDNKIINSIFNNYNIYKFNNYIHLSDVSNYLCFITKDSKNFNVENNTCKGVTFYYPDEIVIIADNQNKWLDSNLTLSDKYLIHEIAHAYTDSFCGNRQHEDDWVFSVELIIKSIGLDKKFTNDIINEYGYKR